MGCPLVNFPGTALMALVFHRNAHFIRCSLCVLHTDIWTPQQCYSSFKTQFPRHLQWDSLGHSADSVWRTCHSQFQGGEFKPCIRLETYFKKEGVWSLLMEEEVHERFPLVMRQQNCGSWRMAPRREASGSVENLLINADCLATQQGS